MNLWNIIYFMQFHAIQLWKATCWNWISSWPRDLSAEKHPSPRRCIRLHFDIHCVFIATMTSQSINTRAFEFLNERFANLKWRSITENAQRPTHGDLPVTSIAFSMTLNLRMSRILIYWDTFRSVSQSDMIRNPEIFRSLYKYSCCPLSQMKNKYMYCVLKNALSLFSSDQRKTRIVFF